MCICATRVVIISGPRGKYVQAWFARHRSPYFSVNLLFYLNFSYAELHIMRSFKLLKKMSPLHHLSSFPKNKKQCIYGCESASASPFSNISIDMTKCITIHNFHLAFAALSCCKFVWPFDTPPRRNLPNHPMNLWCFVTSSGSTRIS